MNKRIMVAVAFAAMVSIGIGLTKAADAPSGGQAVKKQTLCPVMGGPVNPNIFVDYEGKRVYFCCNACPEMFKKNPEKYIKKLEAEGITLDKTPQGVTTNAPAPGAQQHGTGGAVEHGCAHGR